jgi:hypothetical protein
MVELLEQGFFLRREAHTLTCKRGADSRTPAAYRGEFGIGAAVCLVHVRPLRQRIMVS